MSAEELDRSAGWPVRHFEELDYQKKKKWKKNACKLLFKYKIYFLLLLPLVARHVTHCTQIPATAFGIHLDCNEFPDAVREDAIFDSASSWLESRKDKAP